MEDREALIQKLEQLLPYVKRVEKDMKKISKLKAQMEEEIEKQEMWEKNRQNFFRDHPGIVGGILLALFVVFGFLECLFVADADLMLITAGVPSIILTIIICKKMKEGFMDDTEYKTKINQLENELMELETNLREYCKNSSVTAILDTVPKEYFYKEAIKFFLRSFNNCRADTMKEAINLYEEYLYREEMKELQNQHSEAINEVNERLDVQSQMLANQEQMMSKQMSEMQHDLSKTKRTAKVNMALSVYGMLKGK